MLLWMVAIAVYMLIASNGVSIVETPCNTVLATRISKPETFHERLDGELHRLGFVSTITPKWHGPDPANTNWYVRTENGNTLRLRAYESYGSYYLDVVSHTRKFWAPDHSPAFSMVETLNTVLPILASDRMPTDTVQ